jgi:hypothetical protein
MKRVLKFLKALVTTFFPNLANSFLQQVKQWFSNLGEVAYEPSIVIFQAKEGS